MKYKISKNSKSCLLPSKISKFSELGGAVGVVKAILFFCLLRLKSRMQNNNYFAKKFG
jgi:hypothetical protein